MRIAETGEMPLLCNQKPINDNLAAREEGVLLNRRLQADHTTFANQWLRNIATQQHLL